MTAEPITYAEVVELAHAALEGQVPGSPESAERMAALLDGIEGRTIWTGHDHDHTIKGVDVRAGEGKFEINLRISPCPEYVELSIVKVPPPCPECAAGKHGNCDGNTWDNAKDDLAPCPCATGGHA